jgi:hypothetical protein
MSSHQQALDQAKHVGDALSAFVVVGTLVGFLPYVAAILTIIWTGLRIWSDPTTQRIVACLKQRWSR